MTDADRIEYLEAENAMLKSALGHGLLFELPDTRLSPSQNAILACLYTRHIATKEALEAALYLRHNENEPHPKIVDVYILKIRRATEKFGIKIVNRYGIGFLMTTESKRILAPYVHPVAT